MINSDELFGNNFTNKLYDIMYTGMLKNNSEKECLIDDIKNKLESPQKEQFMSLFVRLKSRNGPLDTNFVLRVCHNLLEQNKSSVSILRPNQVIYSNEINTEQLWDDTHCRDNTKTSGLFCEEHEDRINLPPKLMTRPKDTQKQCGRELFLNLSQCSQGMKWTETRVTELGRFHNIIKDYLNSESEHCGRVAKALKFALQKEMNSYYVYVNTWLRENFNELKHRDGFPITEYTPLDHNIIVKFQCLAEVVINAKGKYGYNLLSSINLSSTSEIKNIILNEIAKPIQEMIVHWMIDGEVKDEYGEFFIVETSSENYWDNSHTFSSKNTLSFLNECQLNDIYQTGKNMRFLLKVLGPKMNSKILELRENLKKLGDEDRFLIMLTDKYSSISYTVSDVCAKSSALLMEVLTDKYDMFLHFEGFRNYMLLGRGDFYSYVISELEPYFGNQIMYHYQLKDIIENAYKLTSAANDDKKLFNNFKYRIDSSREVIWKCFKFEYVIDEPLNQIFGPCLNHYANVFEFLWRLKKVGWTTNKSRQELNYFAKKLYNKIELKPVLRNINVLLSSMLTCVNEIQNFMFEMINDEWKRFESETYRATSVKTIIDAHMSFLGSITKCANDASVSLDAYVESLEKNVEKFAIIFQRFVDTSKSLFEDKHTEYINIYKNNFADIKKTFEKELGEFLLKLLKSETRGLGTLALRIDFNSFYSSAGKNVPSQNVQNVVYYGPIQVM